MVDGSNFMVHLVRKYVVSKGSVPLKVGFLQEQAADIQVFPQRSIILAFP